MIGLRTQGLTKRFGGLLVTDDVSLDIRPGELHAIIGPNGAGKTTLVNQLSGELRPDAGAVWLGDEDVTAVPLHGRACRGLLRSYQITSIFEEFTVLENAVLAAIGAKGGGYGFWRAMMGQEDARRQAEDALHATRLEARRDAAAGELGYGERRQLELAMALAAQPRLLLLDEPMAGMSIEESAAVVQLLQSLKGRYSMLLIEHDMDAVFALADRITVLVSGRAAFCGTPDEIRNHPEVRAIYLGDEQGEFTGVAHG
ncbi:ABC transporter ATP-binding protein [Herbaspirillum sp. RV1423]|uniref:ABC transporter ATP-binding protein n=1 Tax=Herbaspirillum sp. RV1423 TaxID=1443993 RepID=UPI0004BB0809|nr:ABC transporter ATP-binding protein [Herbaspirillum sp. RV1423]